MNAQCSTFCMTTGECGHLTAPPGGKFARTAVTRPAHRLLWQSVAGLLVCLLAAAPALAQAPTQFTSMCDKPLTLVFDPIVDGIADTAIGPFGWRSIITGLLVNTFRILAVIEICWAAAIWAFEKDSLNSLAIEFIKKIMFIGFFYMLLTYPTAQNWIYTIPDSFVSIGEQAIKCKNLSTDAILSDAIYYIDSIWQAAPQDFFGILGALGKIIVADFVSLGVLISYVIIAAQYFTLKVESYIMLVASTVFLVFGISSWTNEYVGKYLNYAINVGVRLLVLILVLGLAKDITVMQGFTFDYGPLFQVLAIVILQAILAVKAPELAGALLNGVGGLSAGGAAGSAASVSGGLKSAVSTAAGLVTGGTAAAMGALRTAVSAAQGASPGKAANSGNSPAQGKSGAVAGLGTPAGGVAQQGSQRLTSATKSGASSSGMGKSASGGGTGQSRLAGQNPGTFAAARQNPKQQQLAPSGGGSGSAASAQSGGTGSGANAGTPSAAPGQSELGGKSVSNGASPSGTGGSGRSPVGGSGIQPAAITSPALTPQSDTGSGTEPEESADGVNPAMDGSTSLSSAATLRKATATTQA